MAKSTAEHETLYDEALQKRLESVTANRSQAEIARLTGTQRTNVNRYLKGRRVPASFCMALVDKLGVNPAWLLAGEGAKFLADTAKSTEYLAGDMLELVQAMNVASRMRLGALSGKENLKTLRQLGDGLERYKELKATIGKRSTPIIRDLLDRLEQSLVKGDYDVTLKHIQAIDSIREFCTDDDLLLRLDELRVRYHYSIGESTKAREVLRRLYLHYLPRSREYGDDFFRCAIRLCATLFGEGRFQEALGILRSATALADAQHVGEEIAVRFPSWHALLKYELGDIRAALRVLDQALEHSPDTKRVESLNAHCLFMAGRISVDAAWLVTEHDNEASMELLRCATFNEDSKLLKHFLKRLNKAKTASHAYVIHAQRILQALEGTAPETDAYQNDMKTSQDWPLEVSKIIDDAHFARISGKIAKARSLTLDVHKRIREMQPDAHPYLWARAIHYKNVLKLSIKGAKSISVSMKNEAQSFFETHRDNGYRCFDGV